MPTLCGQSAKHAARPPQDTPAEFIGKWIIIIKKRMNGWKYVLEEVWTDRNGDENEGQMCF